MFVKHGDGKIVSVIEEEELTQKQKKAVEDLSKKTVKNSKTDLSSDSEESGS
jgi:hypothetical protein